MKIVSVLGFGALFTLAVGAVVVATIALVGTRKNTSIDLELKVPTEERELTSKADTSVKTKKLKAVEISTSRTVSLMDEVDDASVSKAMREIALLNEISSDPIYMLIRSPGGSVIDGELLISTMESSKAPVYTVCVELCASMAAMIHQYGKQRYMYDRSILMFHDASLSTQGKFRQTRSILTFLGRKLEKMNRHIANRSDMTYQEFMDLTRDDLWIDGEDAVGLKLADSLIKVTANPLENLSENSSDSEDKRSGRKKILDGDVWTYKLY